MQSNQIKTFNTLGEILDPQYTAVLVVDMQNDFCAENGFIHMTQGADMSRNKVLSEQIGQLVDGARDVGVSVLWIKANYDHETLAGPMLAKMREKGKGAVCCASNSWGADFYEIAPKAGEIVIEKRCYSAFHNTHLDDLLRQRAIKSLVITGVATNVCVESTLREAFFHGYYIVMPPDCVGGTNKTLHEATIKSVELIFGHIPLSHQILGIWQHNEHV